MGCCCKRRQSIEEEPRVAGRRHGRCCCCCCGRRGATILFSFVGLLVASALIAGPVYVYTTDQDYNKLFPIFHYGREYLKELTGEEPNWKKPEQFEKHEQGDRADEVKDNLEEYEYIEGEFGKLVAQRFEADQTYRNAIFQLIDDSENLSKYFAFFLFCVGCLNIPTNVLLFFGAAIRFRCGLIPWLVVTMIELIVIGLPLIIFFGLISLYLAVQSQLYVVAGAMSGIILMSFFIAVSCWFTVYSTYSIIDRYDAYDYGTTDSQIAQPLLSSTSANGGPPPLPPGHPASYHQQGYYPPHSQGRQLPSAPPHSGGIYPQLPMA